MKWERNKNENLTFSINLIGQVMEFMDNTGQRIIIFAINLFFPLQLSKPVAERVGDS